MGEKEVLAPLAWGWAKPPAWAMLAVMSPASPAMRKWGLGLRAVVETEDGFDGADEFAGGE